MQDNAALALQMSANPHQGAQGDLKRKRSPSQPAAPVSKAAKTQTHNHLQINYLARQYDADLPLVNNDATLPDILSLLSDYQGVLDRHESMACNLGARTLGPILMKRFEKMFDGPPLVLKSHGKDGTVVTWLDVVEFARNKPEQFQLGQQSEGVSVCQFYTKQCRVQISEEDYMLIQSGAPHNMIPPQPIPADEEKELGTLDILEKNLSSICLLADQVAARTRQLNHRLKGRMLAILDRRATASPAPPIRAVSPSNVALMNGTAMQPGGPTMVPMTQPPQSSPGGFVAVNSQPPNNSNTNGVSQTTHHELMSKFHTLTDRRASSQPTTVQPKSLYNEARRPSTGALAALHAPAPHSASSKHSPKSSDAGPLIGAGRPSYSDSELQHMKTPVPIPGTPSNLLPTASQRASHPQEKDDGGLFKAEMVRRMESLGKNERILPPCDRCRRLHMDCLKNLTACMGCTKKHAKCSWREVREEELRASFSQQHIDRSGMPSEGEDVENHERASTTSSDAMLTSPRQGVTPIAPAGTVIPHPFQLDDRVGMHNREPPSGLERERDRGVEAQLQETARSGLAQVQHAHARLGASDGKTADYPTMVT